MWYPKIWMIYIDLSWKILLKNGLKWVVEGVPFSYEWPRIGQDVNHALAIITMNSNQK